MVHNLSIGTKCIDVAIVDSLETGYRILGNERLLLWPLNKCKYILIEALYFILDFELFQNKKNA